MDDTPKRNFLVFEQAQNTIIEDNYHTGRVEYQNRALPLIGYNCIGAVAAEDENDAVRAVMGVTRRISRYAVIEATFIDFAVDMKANEVNARGVLERSNGE